MANRAKPDPRVHAWRNDLAAAHLRDAVDAPAYAHGKDRQMIAPVTPLRHAPSDAAMQDSQLLFGEGFRVYDENAGWAWGQSLSDDYVGYVPVENLGPMIAPTHKVAAVRTFVYRQPDIKTRPFMSLSMGARLTIASAGAGAGNGFAELSADTGGGFVFAAHICEMHTHEADPVAVARRFLNVPYFWGGRDSLGLDCSALVQIALTACGKACPRDSDMQAAALGDAVAAPAYGDLVFWQGHVGLMSGGDRLLHASAHHMAVVEEDFATACARIGDTTGPVTAIKRI